MKVKSRHNLETEKENSWDDPEFDILMPPNDAALFEKIGVRFRAMSDIEEVKNDPCYHSTNETAEALIMDYRKDPVRKIENEKFIRTGFQKEIQEEELVNEIREIKYEAALSNINEISSEWINEWNEKKLRKNGPSAKREEIHDFISGSLNPESGKKRTRSEHRKLSAINKSPVIRFATLAAAIITGVVFLIRSLIPSDDPGQIFKKYYEPFSAVSTVTRNSGTSGNESLAGAIGSYRSGDYQMAAAGFSKAMLNETTYLPACFFLGLTELELGNNSRAIELLKVAADRKGGYSTEATWYLGLAYIKTDKVKASGYFEVLAGSPGFYSERAEKILRRLK